MTITGYSNLSPSSVVVYTPLSFTRASLLIEVRSDVFQRVDDRREQERLRAIEGLFDPASRRRILATGLQAGWHCLEVGPGAGSIMNWMGEVVGPTGQVVAVDLDPKLLSDEERPNVRSIRLSNRCMRH